MLTDPFRVEIAGLVRLVSLLDGEVALAKKLLRGSKGNPTASKPFQIIEYLQQAEGVRFEVRSAPAALRTKRRSSSERAQTRKTSSHV